MVSLRHGIRLALAAAFVSPFVAATGSTCSVIPDVDYLGNDIAMTDQADPGKCCADCQATAGCKAYNWYDGVCFLKSAKTEEFPLPGGFSGYVVDSSPAPTTKPTATPTSAPTQAPTSSPTQAPPSCPRIRKSWTSLTTDEKETFISALELSMDKGYYQKFVVIHKEQMSTTEAHGTCVFLFWHRKLLLAFETMLRSLGDRYKCVSLPYWDYVQEYATMQNTPKNKQCRSIEACSPVTTDLGGSSQGFPSRKRLFGAAYPNLRCVTKRPLNHMCEVAGASSRECDHCIPRTNWARIPMIPDMSIDSVRGQVLNSGANIASVSSEIENSPHASIHVMLGGPENNVAISPLDPIFFIHHNTLDLLHTIFYHCRVEPLGLTEEQKKTDSRSFEGCQTGNGDVLGPQSPILMRVDDSGNVVKIEDDPLVGQFFKVLPSQYYQFADVRGLGYAFDLKGLLGDLYNKCDGGERSESLTVNANTTTFEVNHIVESVVLQENLNVLGFQDAVLAQAERQGISRDQGFKEIRKMMILFHENCLPGDISDLPEESKVQWHVKGKSPSFSILEKIRTGEDPILIENWSDLLFEHYGCRGDIKEQ